MSEQPLDRDLTVAERLLSALSKEARHSTLAVFLEMYCRHKRGDTPLNITGAYIIANFMHGRIASSALEGAKQAGYLTVEKLEDKRSSLLHPTEKLIALVQAMVEAEALPWDTVQDMDRSRTLVVQAEKRFDELWPGLVRDHLGQDVTLSCMTGRYVVHDGWDDGKLQAFSSSLGQGDLLTTRKIAPRPATQ